MQDIKIIIGASYGDEGKGLATDFFGAQVQRRHSTINVLTNGGPQRGHTVELADGRRHVFKHFGAASFRGADTYYARQFMVNPMEFVREYEELQEIGGATAAFADPLCRFSTPWDMLVNQMLKEKQGIHNSCGFGIWETVLRYQRGYGITLGAFAAMSREDRLTWLRRLRDGYFAGRLRELGLAHLDERHGLFCPAGAFRHPGGVPGLPTVAPSLEDLFFSDGILFHFDEDCETMLSLCPMRNEEHLRSYQTVLFENAQGLLLDGNAAEEQEFTTPSTTGVGKVLQTVESVFRGADVEVCYVTRSYLTRHGDGSMKACADGEIAADQLGAALPGLVTDMTNVQNRFQGNLRYGMMDVDLLAGRIVADYARCLGAAGNHYHPSIMITHLNEYAGIDTDRLAGQFGTLYLSDGRTCSDTFKVVRRTAI